ncbi:hypothetical protein PoB_004454800 [Plakobranchus ocellatus]|uniref:Uncharacterized protein n=1 Tax=Plakobranchus ocellatus TaxID=259542 RepID=A0AAV4BGS4_9GAST|nr:hypothetical protein PoB_004454800 [Plakobranchus ocellatus]
MPRDKASPCVKNALPYCYARAALLIPAITARWYNVKLLLWNKPASLTSFVREMSQFFQIDTHSQTFLNSRKRKEDNFTNLLNKLIREIRRRREGT